MDNTHVKVSQLQQAATKVNLAGTIVPVRDARTGAAGYRTKSQPGDAGLMSVGNQTVNDFKKMTLLSQGDKRQRPSDNGVGIFGALKIYNSRDSDNVVERTLPLRPHEHFFQISMNDRDGQNYGKTASSRWSSAQQQTVYHVLPARQGTRGGIASLTSNADDMLYQDQSPLNANKWPTVVPKNGKRPCKKAETRPLSIDAEHLDYWEQQRIKYHLLSREAGATLQEDGLPFFLKQMQENKMIKANKLHKLRLCSVGVKPQGALQRTIQPAHGSYILDRMHASEKLYARYRRQKQLRGDKYQSVPVSPESVEIAKLTGMGVDANDMAGGRRSKQLVQLAFSLRQNDESGGYRSPSTGNAVTGQSGLRGDARLQVGNTCNVDGKSCDPWPTVQKEMERSRLEKRSNIKSRNTLRVDGAPTDHSKRSAQQISPHPQRRLTQLRKQLGEVNSGGAVSLDSREGVVVAIDARTTSIEGFECTNYRHPAIAGMGSGQSLRQLIDQSPTLLYDSGSQGAAIDALQACLRSPTLAARPESKDQGKGSAHYNDTLSGKAQGHREGEDHDGDSSRYQSLGQHPQGDSYFSPPALIQLHKTTDNRDTQPEITQASHSRNKKTQSPKPTPLTPSLINKARGGMGSIARASYRNHHGAEMSVSKNSKYSKISIGENQLRELGIQNLKYDSNHNMFANYQTMGSIDEGRGTGASGSLTSRGLDESLQVTQKIIAQPPPMASQRFYRPIQSKIQELRHSNENLPEAPNLKVRISNKNTSKTSRNYKLDVTQGTGQKLEKSMDIAKYKRGLRKAQHEADSKHLSRRHQLQTLSPTSAFSGPHLITTTPRGSTKGGLGSEHTKMSQKQQTNEDAHQNYAKKFNQTVPASSEKPLWVVNKKPQTTIVNYKSNVGQNMLKVSMGDPNFKYLVEHSVPRQQKAPAGRSPEDTAYHESRGQAFSQNTQRIVTAPHDSINTFSPLAHTPDPDQGKNTPVILAGEQGIIDETDEKRGGSRPASSVMKKIQLDYSKSRANARSALDSSQSQLKSKELVASELVVTASQVGKHRVDPEKRDNLLEGAYSASLASNNGFCATIDTRHYPQLELSPMAKSTYQMQPVPDFKVRVSPRFVLQTTGQYVDSKGRMHQIKHVERSHESPGKLGKGVYQKNFENLNIVTPSKANESSIVKRISVNAGTSVEMPIQDSILQDVTPATVIQKQDISVTVQRSKSRDSPKPVSSCPMSTSDQWKVLSALQMQALKQAELVQDIMMGATVGQSTLMKVRRHTVNQTLVESPGKSQKKRVIPATLTENSQYAPGEGQEQGQVAARQRALLSEGAGQTGRHDMFTPGDQRPESKAPNTPAEVDNADTFLEKAVLCDAEPVAVSAQPSAHAVSDYARERSRQAPPAAVASSNSKEIVFQKKHTAEAGLPEVALGAGSAQQLDAGSCAAAAVVKDLETSHTVYAPLPPEGPRTGDSILPKQGSTSEPDREAAGLQEIAGDEADKKMRVTSNFRKSEDASANEVALDSAQVLPVGDVSGGGHSLDAIPKHKKQKSMRQVVELTGTGGKLSAAVSKACELSMMQPSPPPEHEQISELNDDSPSRSNDEERMAKALRVEHLPTHSGEYVNKICSEREVRSRFVASTGARVDSPHAMSLTNQVKSPLETMRGGGTQKTVRPKRGAQTSDINDSGEEQLLDYMQRNMHIYKGMQINTMMPVMRESSIPVSTGGTRRTNVGLHRSRHKDSSPGSLTRSEKCLDTDPNCQRPQKRNARGGPVNTESTYHRKPVSQRTEHGLQRDSPQGGNAISSRSLLHRNTETEQQVNPNQETEPKGDGTTTGIDHRFDPKFVKQFESSPPSGSAKTPPRVATHEKRSKSPSTSHKTKEKDDTIANVAQAQPAVRVEPVGGIHSSVRSQHSEGCGPMSLNGPEDRLRSPMEEELSQMERMADSIERVGSFGGVTGKTGGRLGATNKSFYDNDAQLDKQIRDKPPRYMGRQNNFGIKMKYQGKMARTQVPQKTALARSRELKSTGHGRDQRDHFSTFEAVESQTGHDFSDAGQFQRKSSLTHIAQPGRSSMNTGLVDRDLYEAHRRNIGALIPCVERSPAKLGDFVHTGKPPRTADQHAASKKVSPRLFQNHQILNFGTDGSLESRHPRRNTIFARDDPNQRTATSFPLKEHSAERETPASRFSSDFGGIPAQQSRFAPEGPVNFVLDPWPITTTRKITTLEVGVNRVSGRRPSKSPHHEDGSTTLSHTGAGINCKLLQPKIFNPKLNFAKLPAMLEQQAMQTRKVVDEQEESLKLPQSRHSVPRTTAAGASRPVAHKTTKEPATAHQKKRGNAFHGVHRGLVASNQAARHIGKLTKGSFQNTDDILVDVGSSRREHSLQLVANQYSMPAGPGDFLCYKLVPDGLPLLGSEGSPHETSADLPEHAQATARHEKTLLSPSLETDLPKRARSKEPSKDKDITMQTNQQLIKVSAALAVMQQIGASNSTTSPRSIGSQDSPSINAISRAPGSHTTQASPRKLLTIQKSASPVKTLLAGQPGVSPLAPGSRALFKLPTTAVEDLRREAIERAKQQEVNFGLISQKAQINEKVKPPYLLAKEKRQQVKVHHQAVGIDELPSNQL